MIVDPVPCQHIADYYNHLWENHKCIGWNLLRVGYREYAKGGYIYPVNNLWEIFE